MFKWLFGKSSDRPISETPTLAPADKKKPAAAEAASPRAEPRSPKPAAQNRIMSSKILLLLAATDDLEPTVGLDAVALSPPRLDHAKVIRVQAGGRRVMASFCGEQIVRAYSRRPDGTYRLEGAPTNSPSRLIIGASDSLRTRC